jgi:hypothetical protein
MNSGSSDSLKVSVAHGLSPNARHTRATVGWLIPLALAMSRLDQCVASVGFSVSVLTTTASMSSSPYLRGAPGRGSSCRPSSRFWANRRRHLPTVAGCTLRRVPASVLPNPSAQASTIWQRTAKDCSLLGRRAQRSSVARSSSLSSNASAAGPRRPIPVSNRCRLKPTTRATEQKFLTHQQFMTQVTSHPARI